jgi:hypothetical protein
MNGLILALSLQPAQAADDWTPSPAQQAMYHALSIRDPAPDCAAVEALSQAPLEDLLVLVDRATMPAWVGMRAASCVTTRHAEAGQATLQGWVVDPQKRGLAILVFNQLDEMPAAVALPLASSALQGPLKADAEKRIRKADSAELRALLPATP